MNAAEHQQVLALQTDAFELWGQCRALQALITKAENDHPEVPDGGCWDDDLIAVQRVIETVERSADSLASRLDYVAIEQAARKEVAK